MNREKLIQCTWDELSSYMHQNDIDFMVIIYTNVTYVFGRIKPDIPYQFEVGRNGIDRYDFLGSHPKDIMRIARLPKCLIPGLKKDFNMNMADKINRMSWEEVGEMIDKEGIMIFESWGDYTVLITSKNPIIIEPRVIYEKPGGVKQLVFKTTPFNHVYLRSNFPDRVFRAQTMLT